jgi:tripeptidyl-peptidase-2
VIFVTSAGNSGPALSTVGSPGGSCDDLISVGAYVNPETMTAAHSSLDVVEGTSYTWSSRGPQANGSLGYSIYAPGAAITSVPEYNLYPSRLMNGTSMASPNCAGCVALLVSGLKGEGVSWTPYRVKAALVNSGMDVEDPLKVPFVQVEKAWENLNSINANANFDLFYGISFPAWRKNAGGLYFRGGWECQSVQMQTCNITPRVFQSARESSNAVKLRQDLNLTLRSTVDWIKYVCE